MPTAFEIGVAAVESEIGRAAAEILRDAKQLIGTAYPPASKPGTPPHRRTGNLQASLAVDVLRRDLSVRVSVSSPLPYADYLENGTSRMDARPFGQVIVDKWSIPLADRVARAFADAVSTRR